MTKIENENKNESNRGLKAIKICFNLFFQKPTSKKKTNRITMKSMRKSKS